MATFAERFRQLRKEKNKTLDELAKDLSTTKTTLSRYENEKRLPDVEFVEKATNYFHCSADYLLGLSDIKSIKLENESSNKKQELDDLIVNIKKNITKAENYLINKGKPLSLEEIENIVDAIEVAVEVAKRKNEQMKLSNQNK